MGVVLKNIDLSSVKTPSYIVDRLEKMKMRSLNPLVDISNYVMLEMGFPNHIMDLDDIAGSELSIYPLSEEVNFTTLDEAKRILVVGDTVIADKNGPTVLAGIMGGSRSAVSEKTKNIFIEVANWVPEKVRKTSTRLGLRTDSSMRYEKNLDSHQMKKVLYRLIDLIVKVFPSVLPEGNIISFFKEGELEEKNSVIKTSQKRIEQFLGCKVSPSEIERIFTGLSFEMSKNIEAGDTEYEVRVPSFRSLKDVTIEADLMEEIGRMVGFDSITPVAPKMEVAPIKLTKSYRLKTFLQDFWSAAGGSQEIYSYPLVGEELLDKCQLLDHSLAISSNLTLVNALSVHADRMRSSLIPNFLDAAILNEKNYSSFRFFEIGRRYINGEKNNFCQEENQLMVLFDEEKSNPFVRLLELTEDCLTKMMVPYQLESNLKFMPRWLESSWSGIHPFESMLVKCRGKTIGVISSLGPKLKKKLKLKGQISFLVLDLAILEEASFQDKRKFTPLLKFPGSTFDCTVQVSKDVMVEEILQVFKSMKMKEFQGCRVVDVYEFAESNEKAVTLRSEFFDPDKTLSPELILEGQNRVVSILSEKGYHLKGTQ